MNASKVSEDINHPRRRFIGAAAMTVAAAQFVMAVLRTLKPARRNQTCPQSSRGRTPRSRV